MKLTDSKIFRVLIAAAAAMLLLAPALLMAAVWTELNLEVAIVAVLAVVAIALWRPKWKWICSVIASLLIAIPPYPYWVFSDESRGWYVHFFHGFSLQTTPIATFASCFLIAMLLFAVIFWAMNPRKAS